MTTTSTMPSVAQLDRELNDLVREGRFLDGLERFYAEDVAMQENGAAPTVGKAANRERERQFVESIAQFHEARLLGAAVQGDRSYSEWVLDVTLQSGVRLRLEQVAARQWRDGQVAQERFGGGGGGGGGKGGGGEGGRG
jgi:hypothetical protein